MSAPAAPLTPADITALLGDGWDHDSSPMFDFYVWRKPDGARVDLLKGRLRVWADGKTVEPRNVPADSVTEVRAALTFAGLIPGQVSVRQPRVWNDGDPEPTDVRAVADSKGDRWDREVIGGEVWWLHGVRWQDDIVRMRATWTRLTEHFGPLTEVVDR